MLPCKKTIALCATLMGFAILSGCTSTGPGLAERDAHCTKWREVGPPAKSVRIRVTDKDCKSATMADGNIGA